MEERDISQPMPCPQAGYTYFPRVRGVISMALNVNTPWNYTEGENQMRFCRFRVIAEGPKIAFSACDKGEDLPSIGRVLADRHDPMKAYS